MSGNDTTILIAQAEGGDALQQGVIVSEAGSPDQAPPAEATALHTETGHAEVFPPFDPSTFSGQLVWLTITFVILYVVLSRAALPRIGNIIDSRRARIEGDLREAERLRGETEKAVGAYEAALAEARKNAQKIAEETRDSIKSDIAGKRASVEAELAGRMTEAESRISATKNTALANVDGIAADTAQALVARLSDGVSEAEALSAVAEAKGRV
jgi:F-type H+-transporting ATPase subunit b